IIEKSTPLYTRTELLRLLVLSTGDARYKQRLAAMLLASAFERVQDRGPSPLEDFGLAEHLKGPFSTEEMARFQCDVAESVVQSGEGLNQKLRRLRLIASMDTPEFRRVCNAGRLVGIVLSRDALFANLNESAKAFDYLISASALAASTFRPFLATYL